MSVYPLGGKGGIVSDLVDSPYEGRRNLKVATLSAFSAAGASGRAFARTIPITISAGKAYGVRLEKNANIMISTVAAEGLYITALFGDIQGNILSISNLICTNGINQSDLFCSAEVYDTAPTGDRVLSATDKLTESIYPDGNFVYEIRNNTETTISTFLSIGVQQISDVGKYSILEPITLLTPTTEMSTYNGN